MIGVTNFFRDPDVWNYLRTESHSCPVGATLDGQDAAGVGSPACSSGEEAYSLAIVFKEALASAQHRRTLRASDLCHTDLDPEAIEKARRGFYPANIRGRM